jgi:hypothetical protein
MSVRARVLVVLVAAAVTAVAGVSGAPTARAATRGGCAAVSASAVDQYCEMFPTAGGGHAPSPGDATLGSTLPPHTGRALRGTPLAALPAPNPASRRRLVTLTGVPPAGAAHVSAWSLTLPLILVLAGIALALAAVALNRRRRRATESSA